MIELLAVALMGPASVNEWHDKKPTTFGAVTRSSSCHDPDDAGMNDGDRDCDDHGVPVDGGMAPTIVLGIAAVYVLTRRRGER
jgi:hypothetical protein